MSVSGNRRNEGVGHGASGLGAVQGARLAWGTRALQDLEPRRATLLDLM